jgi:FolB domain-containing protein
VDLQPAGRSDALQDTVDYVRVYERVRGVVEGPACNLLEAVAARIASTVLSEPGVLWVRVRLAKPGVALHGAVRDVAVQITRRRQPESAMPPGRREELPGQSPLPFDEGRQAGRSAEAAS